MSVSLHACSCRHFAKWKWWNNQRKIGLSRNYEKVRHKLSSLTWTRGEAAHGNRVFLRKQTRLRSLQF
ncbi:unnamed protein product [Calypogeia fissa]